MQVPLLRFVADCGPTAVIVHCNTGLETGLEKALDMRSIPAFLHDDALPKSFLMHECPPVATSLKRALDTLFPPRPQRAAA